MECWFKTNPIPHLPGVSTTECPGCGLSVNSGQAMRCRVNGRAEVTQLAAEDREVTFLFGQLMSTPVGLSEGIAL